MPLSDDIAKIDKLTKVLMQKLAKKEDELRQANENTKQLEDELVEAEKLARNFERLLESCREQSLAGGAKHSKQAKRKTNSKKAQAHKKHKAQPRSSTRKPKALRRSKRIMSRLRSKR